MSWWRRAPRVLAVHGFDGHAAKPGSDFDPLAGVLGRRLVRVGYYAGDTGSDLVLDDAAATGTGTSIDVIAGRLAGVVAEGARYGAVDLLGHSMGGLVVLAAVQRLPAAAVRRVVLLGTPLGGLPTAVGCDAVQCREMVPGSPWLAALRARGLRADLVVGSEADADVPADSALDLPGARVALRLPVERAVDHGRLLTDPGVLEVVRRALR